MNLTKYRQRDSIKSRREDSTKSHPRDSTKSCEDGSTKPHPKDASEALITEGELKASNRLFWKSTKISKGLKHFDLYKPLCLRDYVVV